MISDQEIDAKAKEFQLRPLDVQKDYVYDRLIEPYKLEYYVRKKTVEV